jgi:hypothetical protein
VLARRHVDAHQPAATRLRLARLTGGEAAERLRAEARAYFDGERLVSPERLSAVMLPGWETG